MKKIVALFTLFLMAGWMFGQSSTVSTTGVIDTDGFTWIGGTYNIQFKPNPSFPGINQYVWSGGNLQQNLQFSGTLDSSGAFSVSIPDNTTITPAGSQWTFTICPNATTGCFNTSLSVNGATFPVTTQLNALANGPRFPVSVSAHGYADVEISPVPLPGGMYYNVTLAVQRQWNGTAWTTLGGGGGSGTVQPTPQFRLFIQPNPGTNAIAGPATTGTNAVAPILQGLANTDLFQTGGGNNGAANFFASTNCTAGDCYLNFPASSTSTELANGEFSASKFSTRTTDDRGSYHSEAIVNPLLGLNSIFTGDGIPNQTAFPSVVNYTEASPAPTQGSPQRMLAWSYLNGSPGFSGLPPGCPLTCPNPPHTLNSQWSFHGISSVFSGINGAGINNNFSLSASSYGIGDTQLGFVGAEFLNYMGGVVAPSDEGAHMLGSVHANNQGDYFATLASIVDANHIVTTPTGNASTQGQGRFITVTTTAVIGTDGQPLSLIPTDRIRAPGDTHPYGTVISNTAHFPITYAYGTLTNDCTVPEQEGGVAIGQNSGVNGCQVTVTSGTFDTVSPVCMAADRWNQFNIGIKVSVATALSGGHQTLTGTMHRSVPAGGLVFQGGMCGSFLYPEGDTSIETQNGTPVIGSVFPIIVSPDAHTVGYINYDGSQVWGAIPRNGSNWGSTDTGLSIAAHGLDAINLTRVSGVVTGLFQGAGVQSTDRYLGFQQNLFFAVSGCHDASFNTTSNGTFGFLQGPAPNAGNPNVANFGFSQAGPDSSDCATATITLEHHAMSFLWGAEVYDVMNHVTGAVDGTMAVSWQPNWVVGQSMDSPPHYAVVSNVLQLSNEMGVPGTVSSSITINNAFHAAIGGSRTSLGAAITFLNTAPLNETKALGGQALPTDLINVQGYFGNWIRADTAPGPGSYMLLTGPSNGIWNGLASVFHTYGIIGLDNIQGSVKHGLYFNDDTAEWDYRFNFSPAPSFFVNPTVIGASIPIFTDEYRFGVFPGAAFANQPVSHFKQCTPVASTVVPCYASDVEPHAVATPVTTGSTRYDYILHWNDAYGPGWVNGTYTILNGNATPNNTIPCSDLPAGVSGGGIYIFNNSVGWQLSGVCSSSATIVHDTGTYTTVLGVNALIDGIPYYSGAFAATGITGGFLFTQPDFSGLSTPATTITAGISQTSPGVLSVDTTATGNGLGTINAAAANINGSAVCTVATGCSGTGLTLTTTGTSGAATLVGTTLNIPVYAGGTGSVSSVGLNMPGIFTVTGSPVTTSGTLAATLNTQIANVFFAGPSSGGAVTPTFRAIVSGDVPTLNQNTTGTASNLSGTPALPNGTTATTQTLGDNTTKLATDAFVIANRGISGGVSGFLPLFGSTSTITGPSSCDDGITTASTVTCTHAVAVNATGVPSQLDLAPSGTSPATVTGSASLGVPNTVTTPGVYLLPAAPCSGYSTFTNASGIVSTTCTVIPSSATATATPGTGITSVTCATAACSNLRGTFTVVGGTATTGTIFTLAWTATPTAYVCSVTQNDTGVATAYLGLGHTVATTTGITVQAGISVIGTTFNVDYQCQP